ncbi:hypothetical protein GCM10010517_75350 [Streptosporangium fragile]|uniref:Uncharacterized protein n=1 Tax=Streptosporangium fragile TaxID=46186 RepID=A0ABN3WA81_9ACTN
MYWISLITVLLTLVSLVGELPAYRVPDGMGSPDHAYDGGGAYRAPLPGHRRPATVPSAAPAAPAGSCPVTGLPPVTRWRSRSGEGPAITACNIPLGG